MFTLFSLHLCRKEVEKKISNELKLLKLKKIILKQFYRMAKKYFDNI